MTAVTKAILCGAVPGGLVYGLGRALIPRFVISETVIETNKIMSEVAKSSATQSNLNPMERIRALSCSDLKEKIVEMLGQERLNRVESMGGQKSEPPTNSPVLLEEWNSRHPSEQRNAQTLTGSRAIGAFQKSPHPESCTKENQKDAVSSSPGYATMQDLGDDAYKKATIRAQYLGLALAVSSVVFSILAMPNSIREGGGQSILAYRSACVLSSLAGAFFSL